MAKDYPIKLTNPPDSQIAGTQVLERIIHFDSRGFLVETLRRDDFKVGGDQFVMSYTSLTPARVARDEDRWHHHQLQDDRFVCVKGRIALALLDMRENLTTFGRLEVLRMEGAREDLIEQVRQSNLKKDLTTYLVVVPKGVYHCYKNIGEDDCLLQNFPTQFYNAKDEGRTLFVNLPVKSLGYRPFSWSLF